MRVLLICHDDAPLHQDGIARWVSSWGTHAGTLLIQEPRGLIFRRARRELRRVGITGMLDVAAFRAYYRLTKAAADARWRAERLAELHARYGTPPSAPAARTVTSPNSEEAQRFIADCAPDLVIALCKNMLAERVFSIPPLGTFVLHPGICPEYRNAHGCFWALARRDLSNVGLTLLRIDRGIDTGPIFGYFRARYDERKESHRVIQDRMLLDNLDAIRDCFLGIGAGTARPMSTVGRESGEWGQPRLTSYLRWKRSARRQLQTQPQPSVAGQ
jgi:methionyl-tRNA formyltransferase